MGHWPWPRRDGRLALAATGWATAWPVVGASAVDGGRRRRGGDMLHPDAGVDDDGPVRPDDEWIAVELHDLVVSLDHRTDAPQDVCDGGDVTGRRPPVAGQQRRHSQTG